MNSQRSRNVAIGAGVGIIFGAVLGNPGFGLVLGAAAGLFFPPATRDDGE